MLPEERVMRMAMLDWPQERIDSYNKQREVIYKALVDSVETCKDWTEQETYLSALAIAYIQFAQYMENK